MSAKRSRAPEINYVAVSIAASFRQVICDRRGEAVTRGIRRWLERLVSIRPD